MAKYKFNEDEVLIKAMELFWNKGYHATSIQDLVSNLGINRASLYDTFGGKKELFDNGSPYRSAKEATFAGGFFYTVTTASATRIPSSAADKMPPA